MAIGRRADTALETIDKAPAIDLKYLPAHLYRGQALFEQKQHYPGALTLNVRARGIRIVVIGTVTLIAHQATGPNRKRS